MIFRFEQHLALDRESLFAFHKTPANMAMLMEGWPTFRILEHDGTIHCGARVRIAERVGPFWLPMTFEHFLYEPPFRFGERQIKGPFPRFEHVHEFVEEADGTTIIDHLDVELPWWMGGGPATRWLVTPKLRQVFEFRKQSYATLFRNGNIESGGS